MARNLNMPPEERIKILSADPKDGFTVKRKSDGTVGVAVEMPGYFRIMLGALRGPDGECVHDGGWVQGEKGDVVFFAPMNHAWGVRADDFARDYERVS